MRPGSLALAIVLVAKVAVAEPAVPADAVKAELEVSLPQVSTPREPAAEPEPEATPAAQGPLADEEGMLYAFTLSLLSVRDSGPLSYTPFELGYRFSSGLQVRSGLDLFYYEADALPKQEPAKPDLTLRSYRFEMMNWRSTLLYQVPLPISLRPLAGICVEAVRGERIERFKVNQPKEEAWGYLGAGLVLGVEWRFSESAALGAYGRGTQSFDEKTGMVSSLNLSWLYLF